MDDKKIFGKFELVEYKGKYSLVSVREYNGNYYQNWCKIELGKDKHLSDKSQPVKIELGNKEEAINACNWLLKQFFYTNTVDQPQVDISDCPF